MTETSIGDYAFISDCQSAALVKRDGTVEWYCPERFDSPSVFARLLDEDGGHWSIRPTGEFEVERAYLDDTMVLRTVFRTPQGRIALTDALALESGARGHDIGVRVPHVLLRRAEGVEGEVELEVEFSPPPRVRSHHSTRVTDGYWSRGTRRSRRASLGYRLSIRNRWIQGYCAAYVASRRGVGLRTGLPAGIQGRERHHIRLGG
ncbi:MAG TPA: trehalase-like domain-containing protein [Rubrobacteraceae bacterium]|nr:trehalase-like domain-containing protein [Rubrobacteraceae bacterium]